MRYLITFACYGAHIHGDESGSVDPLHNLFGSRFLQSNPQRAAAERSRMPQASYRLGSAESRKAVLRAVEQVCRHRGWNLLAAHVRTNHVHAVVDAEARPEKVMNDFKAYATRALNQLDRDEPSRKRWARHGSTRWLWTDQDVRDAIRYVVDEQGEPMALLVGDAP